MCFPFCKDLSGMISWNKFDKYLARRYLLIHIHPSRLRSSGCIRISTSVRGIYLLHVVKVGEVELIRFAAL